ncbi:MAG: HetZ-related protein 2 [Cyanobacteria bacterium Co-bin13]|nr:HetZ-related protein 2 [Cyanobacteria bacterium Co-bin13]
MSVSEKIVENWRLRLQADYPDQEQAVQNSIVQWLLGEDINRFDDMSADDLQIACQAIEYRYRILQQRYWGVGPERAYQHLIKRLSSLFLIRSKVRTWIALSRDRHRTVVDVLQEVIQEMLQSDRHLAQQTAWIGHCTRNSRLRNLLMLASLEEYSLRPIRNQPLIIYRFVNHLRRSQKGGMTQVPSGELVRLVSDEIAGDDSDTTLSLLDTEAINSYQEEASLIEQQTLREQVKRNFLGYLSRSLDDTAVQWLEMHLKGYSQEVIAERLSLPVQQVYRLREKVSYHAIRVFTLREQPDLVFSWLKTSLQEHNFGLTPSEWAQFLADRSAQERRLLEAFKAGQSVDEIAQTLKLKPRQVQTHWAQLYLEAQALRTKGEYP